MRGRNRAAARSMALFAFARSSGGNGWDELDDHQRELFLGDAEGFRSAGACHLMALQQPEAVVDAVRSVSPIGSRPHGRPGTCTYTSTTTRRVGLPWTRPS